MMKLYIEKSSEKKQPKKETIQFLLGYSKSLKVIKSENKTYEFRLN